MTEQNAKGELAANDEKKERDPKRRRRSEALVEWRKEVAAKRKVVPSVVLPNQLVEDLAALDPSDVGAVSRVPYLGAKRTALYASEILEAMKPHR